MPARHAVMKYVCKKETSECCIVYTGEKDVVFFGTIKRNIRCGSDDFSHHLLETHDNFGTFFKDMERKYKTFHHGFANFISVSTVGNCFLNGQLLYKLISEHPSISFVVALQRNWLVAEHILGYLLGNCNYIL